ncbi:MAG: DUF1302 family protein [Myxococcota bacterium]
MRAISADYAEQWDIVQWYQIFNLEVELDILPDGIGFIDSISGFVRAEVRYDCVYSRGCGTMRNVNTVGDRAKRLPRRLANGRENVAAGAFLVEPEGERLSKNRDPVPLSEVAGFKTAAEQEGADNRLGGVKTSWTKSVFVQGEGFQETTIQSRFDDPFPYLFERFDDFRFTHVQQIGGGMNGLPVAIMGPWLPKNFIVANAGLADRINPFDDSRQSPVVKAAAYNSAFKSKYVDEGRTLGRPERAASFARTVTGSGALPFRPIPPQDEGNYGVKNGRARGIYIPSRPARELIQAGKIDDFTNALNFRESERAWNRGASQQDEKELKEAYLDIDMFDSRLWLRIGKQQIVWGKTELFRTTDQFNPQDVALASLPSLEESRIALWSARAVYSFYEVGPLEDVRLELAVNYDDYESADFGACGEAFTVNLVCQGAFGAFAHGLTGIGLLGARTPEDPWNDRRGIEFGGRLEWRWDRFSFAISDFYGYDDFPYVERVSTFERNVDPKSGRPRIMGSRNPCPQGYEDECLMPGPSKSRTKSTVVGHYNDPDNQKRHRKAYRSKPDSYQNVPKVAFNDPNNALLNHSANQQVFAMICATTIGVVDLDGSACAQNVFGSVAPALDLPGVNFTVGQAASAILAGSEQAARLIFLRTGFNLADFLVELNADINDVGAGSNPNTTRLVRQNNIDAGGNISNKDPGGSNKALRLSTECLDYNFNPAGMPCGGVPVGDPRAAGSGDFMREGLALTQKLSPYQEALIGCGPFFGTNCDDSGIDWLNAEYTSMMQSFVGFEGTRAGWRTDNSLLGPQPGTIGFVGGPVCLSNYLWPEGHKNRSRGDIRLPGCRSAYKADGSVKDRRAGNPLLLVEYNAAKDGCVRYDPNVPGCNDPSLRTLEQPILKMTQGVSQVFENEMAALSWNFMMLTASQDDEFKKFQKQAKKKKIAKLADQGINVGESDPRVQKASRNEALKAGQCSMVTPQYCENIQGLLRLGGISRPDVKASGNGTFGRRSFTWHNGGELVIRANKRNVLGFSSDFAIDSLKSNFSMEFTWIPDNPRSNTESYDGLIEVDQYNLTVSADRPTFINFLNANRTFFFNTQWFFQYLDGYRKGSGAGPWNVLMTFAVTTGYYQDRLLPTVAAVYDFRSVSGAVLPQVTYRYNEAFSVTVGANIFMGKADQVDMSVNPVALSNRVQGRRTYKNQAENGLAVFRDRDEVFVRLRYTF